VSVRVDLARSTAPGPVGAQLVIRLVLRLDAPLPAAPSVLEIESAGERLRVALRG
jgi:hypothetical protein